jgi:dynein heavy chain
MPMAGATLYEYYFDGETKQWVPWQAKIPKYVHEPDRKFKDILVPTVDTVRTQWLISLQVDVKRPVLLVGETGTSKTATTANFLGEMNKETYV